MKGGMHHITLEHGNYVQSVMNPQEDVRMIVYILKMALAHYVKSAIRYSGAKKHCRFEMTTLK